MDARGAKRPDLAADGDEILGVVFQSVVKLVFGLV
jgi:hypothetical protein